MLKEMVVRWQERSGEYGRWGKTWKPNLFNFWSAGCAMCDWVLSWRIGPFQSTNELQALQLLLLNDDYYYYYYFLISFQLTRHALTELFHLCNLLQMPDDHRMVKIEFFKSFPFSRKRISFDDGSQLVVVNFRWPATTLVSFAKLLELPLRCMFVSSSWAKCIVDVASFPQCFTTHFELE